MYFGKAIIIPILIYCKSESGRIVILDAPVIHNYAHIENILFTR